MFHSLHYRHPVPWNQCSTYTTLLLVHQSYRDKMFYSITKRPSSGYTFICRNTKLGNHWFLCISHTKLCNHWLLYCCISHTKQSNHWFLCISHSKLGNHWFLRISHTILCNHRLLYHWISHTKLGNHWLIYHCISPYECITWWYLAETCQPCKTNTPIKI